MISTRNGEIKKLNSALKNIEVIGLANTLSSASLNTLELSFYEIGGKYRQNTNEFYRRFYLESARTYNDVALNVNFK